MGFVKDVPNFSDFSDFSRQFHEFSDLSDFFRNVQQCSDFFKLLKQLYKLKKTDLIQFILSKKKAIIIKKKINNKLLNNLVKNIKNSDLQTLLNKTNKASKKGYLYEKLWDIIIKCGYCPNFNSSLFQHMDGNINMGKMKVIKDLEYYLKNNKIFSKNKGGSSDITLQKNDGTWIFISSKFYNDDSKKSIKDYVQSLSQKNRI